MTKNIFIHPEIFDAWFNHDYRYVVVASGRGFGKTTQAAMIISLETVNKKLRVLNIRGFQKTLKDSSLAALKMAIGQLGIDDKFTITENSLKSITGSDFIFSGSQNPYSWKSLTDIDIVWIDEATELTELAWEILLPTIRKANARFIVTYNPTLEDDYVYKTFNPEAKNYVPFPDSVHITLKPSDPYDFQTFLDINPFFSKANRLEMEYHRATDLEKFNHVWMGQLRLDTKNALFKKSWIKYTQENSNINYIINCLEKIVVAIDPAVSNKTSSDACGLVVAGKFIGESKYIILEDCTKIQSPKEWATEAIQLFTKYHANYIVYEKNQGGDMVRTIFDQIVANLPLKDVWAKKGKLLRAEPVAVLYEKGLVEHFEIFPILEKEMVTYTGESGEASPNSLDAMVYALMELIDLDGYTVMSFTGEQEFDGLIDPRAIEETQRISQMLRGDNNEGHS